MRLEEFHADVEGQGDFTIERGAELCTADSMLTEAALPCTVLPVPDFG